MKQGKKIDTPYDINGPDIAWCPGCGNFKIIDSLKLALADLKIKPEKLVLVSGIGQAAKIPQYLKCNYFNGLHGRSLPVATAVKASNRELTVIAVSGDGCTYGEGGNHFIHCVRRNTDITHLVHDNMVYGLTKGQASPTSQPGFKTPVQTGGVFLEPFPPLAVAISLNASFVARAFAGDVDETRALIKAAVRHKGYALVDILQPCVSFNKVNTFKWFKNNTAYLESSYDPGNRQAAFARALEMDPIPLGILYRQKGRKTFEEQLPAYAEVGTPLFMREVKTEALKGIIQSKV